MYLVDEGDLLFTRSSLVKSGAGMVAMINNKPAETILFCGFIIRFRPDKTKVNPLFLLYLLRSPNYRKLFTDGSVQTNISNINQDSLGNIEVELPSLKEQNNTVRILDLCDSKIELNNRINAELEAMSKTIYNYWFVQFDFPNAKRQALQNKWWKMEFSKELKKEIPKGWKVTKMAEWIVSDKSEIGERKKQKEITSKVTCIRGTDINSLNGLKDTKQPIRYILEKNLFKALNSHDLIVEISGGSPTQSTGRMAYITDATLKRFDTPLICSNFCKAISIKDKKLLYNFVYYWNSLYDSGAFFGYEGKTSGIKNLLFDSFVNSYYTVVSRRGNCR
ncbi:MAG: restriction endonuclease subunit S [Bacteroidetes bacterium]|nr:restriction endonuclease subunit S [Bacteroidota bacterium]